MAETDDATVATEPFRRIRYVHCGETLRLVDVHYVHLAVALSIDKFFILCGELYMTSEFFEMGERFELPMIPPVIGRELIAHCHKFRREDGFWQKDEEPRVVGGDDVTG